MTASMRRSSRPPLLQRAFLQMAFWQCATHVFTSSWQTRGVRCNRVLSLRSSFREALYPKPARGDSCPEEQYLLGGSPFWGGTWVSATFTAGCGCAKSCSTLSCGWLPVADLNHSDLVAPFGDWAMTKVTNGIPAARAEFTGGLRLVVLLRITVEKPTRSNDETQRPILGRHWVSSDFPVQRWPRDTRNWRERLRLHRRCYFEAADFYRALQGHKRTGVWCLEEDFPVRWLFQDDCASGFLWPRRGTLQSASIMYLLRLCICTSFYLTHAVSLLECSRDWSNQMMLSSLAPCKVFGFVNFERTASIPATVEESIPL